MANYIATGQPRHITHDGSDKIGSLEHYSELKKFSLQTLRETLIKYLSSSYTLNDINKDLGRKDLAVCDLMILKIISNVLKTGSSRDWELLLNRVVGRVPDLTVLEMYDLKSMDDETLCKLVHQSLEVIRDTHLKNNREMTKDVWDKSEQAYD